MIGAILHAYSHLDEPRTLAMLSQMGWTERYVKIQIYNLKSLSLSTEGQVLVAKVHDEVAGYIQAQHHPWNRLSQIQGLVVALPHRRQGLARLLIQRVEANARERGQRGIYVDTPLDNLTVRSLYESEGYREAYTMPQYYGPGLDGVTYQKMLPQS